MVTPARHDIRIRIGTTFVLDGDAPEDDTGAALSIAGATFTCQVRREVGGEILATGTGSLPTSTTWRITIPKATTAALLPGTGVYDVICTYADGTADVYCEGAVEIVRTVTA